MLLLFARRENWNNELYVILPLAEIIQNIASLLYSIGFFFYIVVKIVDEFRDGWGEVRVIGVNNVGWLKFFDNLILHPNFFWLQSFKISKFFSTKLQN